MADLLVCQWLNYEFLPNVFNVTFVLQDAALVGGSPCTVKFNVTIVITRTQWNQWLLYLFACLSVCLPRYLYFSFRHCSCRTDLNTPPVVTSPLNPVFPENLPIGTEIYNTTVADVNPNYSSR